MSLDFCNFNLRGLINLIYLERTGMDLVEEQLNDHRVIESHALVSVLNTKQLYSISVKLKFRNIKNQIEKTTFGSKRTRRLRKLHREL